MNQQAYRCLPVIPVVFALLLILPGQAVAGEREGRDRAPAEASRLDELPSQAACPACNIAQTKCYSGCFGADDKAGMGTCLTACDNAAATCSCEERATLHSEDLLPRPDRFMKAACHSTTPCGSEFGSCASWSAYFDCDDPFCGFGAHCGEECPEIGPCPGPALKQRQERYQVCFDQFGNQCTQYQRITLNLGCGY